MMAHDLPPWHTVYQQTQRWLRAGVFEDMVHDLRMLMREIDDRMQHPRAAILDSRTLQFSWTRNDLARLPFGTRAPDP